MKQVKLYEEPSFPELPNEHVAPKACYISPPTQSKVRTSCSTLVHFDIYRRIRLEIHSELLWRRLHRKNN